MRDPISKELIVVVGNMIFFGLCLCIWIVAKIFPAWDARQRARQQERAHRHVEQEE